MPYVNIKITKEGQVTLEQKRRLIDAEVGEELCGLRRQGAQAARLVGVAVVVHLVQELRQHDGGHDGVVIGILMSKDEYGAHRGSLSHEEAGHMSRQRIEHTVS